MRATTISSCSSVGSRPRSCIVRAATIAAFSHRSPACDKIVASSSSTSMRNLPCVGWPAGAGRPHCDSRAVGWARGRLGRLHNRPGPPKQPAPAAEEPKGDRRVQTPFRFPARADRARLRPSVLGLRRPRREGAERIAGRLYRLRLHRAVAARRLAAADHDAALAAADRRQAAGADGRRHDHGRRSLGQGRDRASC